jgi:hypothetical protein
MISGMLDTSLQRMLLADANSRGGWAYYAGKASRLEPTCWALLALSAPGVAGTGLAPHSQFLSGCQQPNGWLVEDPHWPVNIAFNGLAAFTWSVRRELATDEQRRRLVAALVKSKGVKAPQSENFAQDNSLQGWSWIDSTFSWVEPTCWGLLALKKMRSAGFADQAAQARIPEAEQLLIDRTCRAGGWNFGNATVMHQDLRPYVPTTALGLLALQDRRNEPAVTRSVDYLENHWIDEVSAPAMGLSLACLNVYGRPLDKIEARLRAHAERAASFGNLHGVAVALFALSLNTQTNVFRL